MLTIISARQNKHYDNNREFSNVINSKREKTVIDKKKNYDHEIKKLKNNIKDRNRTPHQKKKKKKDKIIKKKIKDWYSLE